MLLLEESEKQKFKIDEERKKAKDLRAKDLTATLSKALANKFTQKKLLSVEKQKEQEDNQQWEAASLARLTKEKLIVNFLKQVILFGTEMVKQSLKNQLLQSFTKIEREIKVKSRSINYLMQLYGEDIPQMLQYYVENEIDSNGSTTTEKINMQIERMSASLLPAVNQLTLATEESVSPLKKITKKELHLEKAVKELEKIKNNLTLKKDYQHLAEELKKARDDKLKAQAKKLVDTRKFMEHGVIPKQVRNYSLDSKKDLKED